MAGVAVAGVAMAGVAMAGTAAGPPVPAIAGDAASAAVAMISETMTMRRRVSIQPFHTRGLGIDCEFSPRLLGKFFREIQSPFPLESDRSAPPSESTDRVTRHTNKEDTNGNPK
jgi:hypothetical protein